MSSKRKPSTQGSSSSKRLLHLLPRLIHPRISSFAESASDQVPSYTRSAASMSSRRHGDGGCLLPTLCLATRLSNEQTLSSPRALVTYIFQLLSSSFTSLLPPLLRPHLHPQFYCLNLRAGFASSSMLLASTDMLVCSKSTLNSMGNGLSSGLWNRVSFLTRTCIWHLSQVQAFKAGL